MPRLPHQHGGLDEMIQSLTTSLARQHEQLAAVSAQVEALSQHVYRLTVHGIAHLEMNRISTPQR